MAQHKWHKKEFKKRWELDNQGGDITWDDIAECAVQWGISPNPRTKNMDIIRCLVLKAANVKNYESFIPKEPYKLCSDFRLVDALLKAPKEKTT